MDQDEIWRFLTQTYDPTVRKPSSHYFESYQNQLSETETRIDELYHENTKLNPKNEIDFTEAAQIFNSDPTAKAVRRRSHPDYATDEIIHLPVKTDREFETIDAVLESRRSRRRFSGDGLSTDELSDLLRYSLGVTEEVGRTDETGDGPTESLRAYPSPGAMYPVEPYVVVPTSAGDVDAGIYYYVPEEHALRVLDRPEALRDELHDCIRDPTSRSMDFSVLVGLAGAFQRTRMKYGPRGYRFALQESGHAAQNVLLVAEAMGLAGVPMADFYDERLNEFLGVDGVNESVLYLLCLGKPEDE